MTDADRIRELRAEIEAERDAREAALAGKVAELLGLTPHPAPRPAPEPKPDRKEKPVPEPTADHEIEAGKALLAQLGHKPAPPPAPEAPRLTPGRLREVLGGGPDYAAIEAAEAARLAHVREDALKIARTDPEDGARFARKWGDHQTAEQIENANREDAAS